MQTRAEYMQSMTDCGPLNNPENKIRRELIHHYYYMQFNNAVLEKLVLKWFDLDALKKAYTTNPNLNNIPLKQ